MTGLSYWSDGNCDRIRLQGPLSGDTGSRPANGERIVISKRGLPVAELGPATKAGEKYPQFDLKNSVTVLGDIVEPAVPEHFWESLER